MTNRILIGVLLASLLAALAAFSPSTAPAVQDDDDTQLALYMKDINKTLRGLRSSLRDAERNADSITNVRGLQLLITKARGEKPARTGELPDGDRAAYTLEFQKQMLDFGMKVMELESALLDDDNESAQEVWKSVNEMKSPAHEKFKVKD